MSVCIHSDADHRHASVRSIGSVSAVCSRDAICAVRTIMAMVDLHRFALMKVHSVTYNHTIFDDVRNPGHIVIALKCGHDTLLGSDVFVEPSA